MTEHEDGTTGGDAAGEDGPRMVGVNHVALEVGDLAAAESFYGSVFELRVRGRTETGLFLDMGDQFLPLMEVEETGPPDDHRHVGLVVDDAAAVERRLRDADAELLDARGLEFQDPWGNRLQVVEYRDVQFTKADHVLAGMGVDGAKNEDALAELAAKGMAPEEG